MQFYDSSNNQGLCQLLDDLCDTTDTEYTRVRKTRDLNMALNRVVGWIIQADGTWQYDDTNLSNAPRGKGNLVEGQEYYTFASDYLQIEEIDILDNNLLYKRIMPIDPQDFDTISPEELFGVTSGGNPQTGFPQYYDIKGDSIRLYPAPTATVVTLTNGIRVSFKRKAQQFTVASDTSADVTEPGLDINHEILAYIAAIPYCIKYHKDRVPEYKLEINELKDGLIKHYSHRELSRRGIITRKHRAFK